jgi:cellulose synthase/poly-beta-1,6-N-acetylglucosamine synthase-like glycosyltransferase
MTAILHILFWLSVFLVFHSYVLFPFYLKIRAGGKILKFAELDEKNLPFISILVSAFNEEAVIGKKIESVFKTDYPSDRFELIIGSDNSTDQTNKIVESWSEKYKNLSLIPYKTRRGKQNVVNDLYKLSKGRIIILTDANVLFDTNTIKEIARAFKDPKVGLVDTNMINRGLKKEGISYQEKAYISREVKIKNHESLIWGCMMGPFGGCFAIRHEDFTPIPSNALVDDFYVNMKILEKGKKAVNNLNARVFEDVSNDLKIEIIRKIRIATGNFQNLRWFGHLLWPINTGIAFTFLSHKVLRWLGPFFLILSFASSFLLSHISIYRLALILQIVGFLVPFIDALLRKLNIHNKWLRFITHFYSMNLALLIGFFRFTKGVKSGVWRVTKRNQ